ncbi:hypothetical protein [Lacinutrix mariniflava]|uniref:hypothetical protein n=1 Tax=Lacinutrix mariniflava TaxID=342955 RepID=UPI0006E45C14|nr:hypothetical protein [Lacinutrix mariniflava]
MFSRSFSSVILVLCSLFCLASCGQNKQDVKTRPITQLYENAKQLDYPSMPQYYIEGYQSGCYYELYINGIMVFKHYENVGLSNHAVNINQNILQSGPQKITIKLFPLGEIDGENYTTIDPDDSFRLKIFSRDKQKPYKAFDYDFLQEHKVDIKTSVPYFEETITFNAEVPYTLEGWSNSQVLTDMDQDVLEQEILAFYENFGTVINTQDEKAWVDLMETREKEYFKAVFYNDNNDEELKARIEDFTATFDSDFQEKFPLDKYEMLLSKDGKIVTLKSLERKGKSAFSYGVRKEYNGKQRKIKTSSYLFLHKPKGSNKLEIIR